MATAAPGAGAGQPDAGYLFGIAMVALAGVFWSIGGILIRWIEAADAWQIIFYRSAALALTLTLIVALRHRGRLVAAFAAAGWNGVLAGAGLSGGFIGYVLALHHTTVANAVFMLGTAPFFAAILGRWFLSEAVRPATWAAMSLALAGIAVMVAGSLVLGTILGNLLALVASLSFAVFNVLLRRGRDTDMLPCVVIAGVIAALIALPVVVASHPDAFGALVLSARDLGLCLIMGGVQVGPRPDRVHARRALRQRGRARAGGDDRAAAGAALGLDRRRRGAERLHAGGRRGGDGGDRLPGALRRPPPPPAAAGVAAACNRCYRARIGSARGTDHAEHGQL